MSEPTTHTAAHPADPADHAAHPPFLAHHYESPEQQYRSNKIGMWVFLATEILMFGGLFCAYAVYRAHHPDVFLYAAEKYLSKVLGAINTVVLITSSLTMAWAVRCAQINKRRGLIICLGLTILGGAGFMAIKAIEYHEKWKHHVWVGTANKYSKEYTGAKEAGPKAVPLPPPPATPAKSEWKDANAGTPDESKIKPPVAAGPGGLTAAITAQAHRTLEYTDLNPQDRERIATFFNVYFLMTGLHGLHVVIGMGLITWVLLRALKSEFSSHYFTPVDLVGLYWHLVDLIWIFLFPLLYLIR